jgi:hypothetical protein
MQITLSGVVKATDFVAKVLSFGDKAINVALMVGDLIPATMPFALALQAEKAVIDNVAGAAGSIASAVAGGQSALSAFEQYAPGGLQTLLKIALGDNEGEVVANQIAFAETIAKGFQSNFTPQDPRFARDQQH